MGRRVVAFIVTIVVLGAGCSRSDSGDEAEGEAVVSAKGDSGSGTSAAGTAAGDGESVAAPAGSAVECTLTDDGIGFDLHFANEGAEAASYQGDVDLVNGATVVGQASVSIPYVAPGEVVREYGYTGLGAEETVTGCAADQVERVVEPVPLLAVGDVGPCENFRPGQSGNFAYELTVTNRSTTITAAYAVRVALRNPEGERRASRILFFGEGGPGGGDLAPGESRTATDETLGAPYAEGYSCEVFSVDKYTDAPFFEDTSAGVATGSLSADVGFASGSAELTDDARVLLAEPIGDIVSRGGPVCVEGFADSVGDDEANLALSQARADAVAALIREAGATNEIEAVGRGEQEATADGVDDPTLRRVDITLALCPA